MFEDEREISVKGKGGKEREVSLEKLISVSYSTNRGIPSPPAKARITLAS